MPTPPEVHIDVLIFGGGIAGLWTLARLRKEGYSCLLLESNALGAGQTIASQGIIHGGIKYALTGQASAASKAIAEMPAIWRACLRGEGEVDLRAAKVLSEHQYLWTAPGLLGRAAGFGASVAMRAGVERVSGEQAPDLLRTAPRGVDIYRVDEPVLDPRTVVQAIAGAHQDSIRAYAGPDHLRTEPPEDRRTFRAITILDRPGGAPALRIVPGFVLLAAGAGNDTLLETLGVIPLMPMQRRPLHMVMATDAPGPLFGHCVGASSLPRLTITSNRGPDGAWVWYIGGAIAEAEGVARSPADQIAATRDELAGCAPWLNSPHLKFSTLRVDRAEAVDRIENPLRRPDEPRVFGARSFAAAWPTKLAFAPAVASRILQQVRDDQVSRTGKTPELPMLLHPAPVAQFPWDREGLTWT